ncbi:MAG: type I restriction enzyme S subunit [Alteromonadaceae bacterium]|jgi:type I restriction enzyme S subunit
MTDVNKLITDNIDVWTSAIKKRNTTGRGSSKKIELTGVKKLRELILELAVRGKLVPQDANDEPASILLERIAVEKTQLIADKKIKKQKPLPAITDGEKPFALPSGWEWSQLGAICEIGPRNQLADDLDVGFVPMPLISTSYKGNHGLEIRKWSEIKKGYTHFADGDIGLAKITPCFENSKAAVFSHLTNGYGAGTTELHIARPIKNTLDPLFILLFLKAPMFLEVGKSKMTGSAGQKRVPSDYFSGRELPFAPLAEQHRIVAKVDELMSLCDELEQQTEQSLTAHQTLVEVLLAALTKSDSTEDFQTSWQRIAEHFDVLFTTEHSIEQLKQTILQLAAMGKLVPQNPSDEPVDKLLARIASHRDERVKNKEMQKFKLVKPIDDPNSEVPLSWKSILLNDLVFVTKLAGFEYTKHIDLKDSGEVPVIRAQNVRPFRPDLRNLKYIDEETSMALPRSALDRAALLITFIGAGIGDVCLLNENKRFHLAPNVAKVEAFSDLSLQYLSVYLNSPLGKVELFKSMKSTAQPSISMTTLREMWVSLPPLAEQHRIVAKVDELIALCEKLKARLSDSQTTQLHLADAVVENALNDAII